MRILDVAERRRRLMHRHHLTGGRSDPVAAADALVGFHSSDPATVFLSAWARGAAATPRAVERILYERRSLVRVLGMRRTLFAVPVPLVPILDTACAARYAASERRRLVKMLETQGIAGDGAAWIEEVMANVVSELQRRGAATASELGAVVPELRERLVFGEGRKWGGAVGVSTRVMFLLATEGRIVRGRPRGSWLSSQYEWTPAEIWLGEPIGAMKASAARRELAVRYLRSYGPATETDVSWWTGWGVRDTRAALDAAGAVTIALDDGASGYVLPADLEDTPPAEMVALLPGLDSTVMGWKERDWFLGPHRARLFDRNGNAGPTVWWDGRIVGGWGQTPSGSVRFELLEDVPGRTRDEIGARAAELEAWLDGVRVTPRFGTPLERAIAAAEA